MRRLLALSLLYIASAQVARAAKTVTFEDVATPSDYQVIQNGYEGLQWKGFAVMNGSTIATPPTNVAFNLAQDPSSIRCGNPFHLHTGYLTGRFGDYQIRVRGLVGTNVAYDNLYAISNEGPALINFNYLGIDKVEFLPSGNGFVLDNLSVTVTNFPSVNYQHVEVSTLGHAFWDLSRPPYPQDELNLVNDYLIDQEQYSGGGGVLRPVSANFDTNNQFALTISAPVGKKFLVRPPAGQDVRFIADDLRWRYDDNASGGEAEPGNLAVSFGGLEGTPPDFPTSGPIMGTYHGSFFFSPILSSRFTNDLSFTSMTLTATFVSQYTNSGTLNYLPNGSDYLRLAYETFETNDPGPFVWIVPAGPAVSMRLESNGNLTVSFTGVLQWATNVQGPYGDVPGHPEGTFTIPRVSLGFQQYFRARGN